MRFSSSGHETLDQLYSLSKQGCLRVYGSLPNQSTCALWIWRRHSTVSLVVFCGECSASMAVRVANPNPEQELGSCIAGSSVARGQRESRFGNHRISSLLFADDVVLLASSSPPWDSKKAGYSVLLLSQGAGSRAQAMLCG
ncbi:hypothetical protein L3Q82_009848, partial [Scortum barcoo]